MTLVFIAHLAGEPTGLKEDGLYKTERIITSKQAGTVSLESRRKVISDALNHASIIDGVRLCKAKRFRYANSDMTDLETQLRAAKNCPFKLIATDGVCSMDGYIARLGDICDLAEQYGAMVMVDESHAVGFVGKTGRGSIVCGAQPRRIGPCH